MIKIQVTQKDVQAAKRFLSKQPGTPTEIHDPIAQALKRTFSNDPRWCRPQVNEETIDFVPRQKYPNLEGISVSLPKKVQQYCRNFDQWYDDGFVGKGPGTIEFTLKGVSLVDGRLQVG